jgi:hypothetical protein
MSERHQLFRQEALDFHSRGRQPTGGGLRLGAPWLRWSYRAMVVLVVVGLVAGWLVRADASTTGPAVVDAHNGTFSGMVPAAVAPQLRDADAVRLDLGKGAATVAVKVSRAETADGRVLRRSGLPAAEQPAIVLSGRLPSGAAIGGRPPPQSRVAARMTVVLRSERFGEVIVRRLKLMLGKTEDAQ